MKILIFYEIRRPEKWQNVFEKIYAREKQVQGRAEFQTARYSVPGVSQGCNHCEFINFVLLAAIILSGTTLFEIKRCFRI